MSADAAATLPSRSDQRPAEVRLNHLLAGEAPAEPRLTVAAAESCTGGNVAARITSVAGSSAYFLGSVVTYANSAKQALLGVPSSILAERGAVSDECARAMAEGARRAFGADLAVATTGIAGPGGATARKPVGLVYLAAAGPGSVMSVEHHFPGDRAAVIDAATEAALRLLVSEVERLRPHLPARVGPLGPPILGRDDERNGG